MRPMLAAKITKPLVLPLLASPKIDGVRAVVMKGQVYSRSLKLIPNCHVQKLFGHPLLNGLDGELVVGNVADANVMQHTMSGVMSMAGVPSVTYWVFDVWHSSAKYEDRLQLLMQYPDMQGIVRVVQTVVHSLEELLAYEEQILSLGYEGVMLRRADARYKFGRSTEKEAALLKLKRFSDSEAVVVGKEELFVNGNTATVNNLGLTERSSHQDNMMRTGTLGALIVEDLHSGARFRIGSGFTQEQRRLLWHVDLRGSVVKYKYFKLGVVDLPRFPIFLGFRDTRDL